MGDFFDIFNYCESKAVDFCQFDEEHCEEAGETLSCRPRFDFIINVQLL